MEDSTNAQAVEMIPVPVEEPTPTLSEPQILEAATNAPELSPDEFVLGERTFKIVHLPYDDYVTFLGYLQPFLETLISKKAKDANVSIPGIDLGVTADANSLIRFCVRNLPEMVHLIVKQTDATISTEQIKELAGNPFVLSGIVLKQVAKNGMIRDFASFFKQVTPLLRVVK